MALVFVCDDMPGISRRRLRGKWAYFAPDGERIKDPAEVQRLNAIALPPAYSDAWFAPAPNAHLLATGYDARGRKQYRYHPEFRREREARKFDDCAGFGSMLPLIRHRVEADIRSTVLSRERAVASIVRLLDTGAIRVGNEAYARDNKSFGATTLRMRHASIASASLRLSFRAKSGKQCTLRVSDRGLVRFVKAMQDLPGQSLFQYVGDGGDPLPVTSGDVNTYLRETMGQDYTAKDFRTWHASVIAFQTLHAGGGKVPAKAMFEAVAQQLGNTPAVARKSYIHPAIIAALDQQDNVHSMRLPRATRWLSRHERGLLDFLADQPGSRELLSA